ncbi:MAG: ankyrin repeat protein [Kiritimatiellia bacterium]
MLAGKTAQRGNFPFLFRQSQNAVYRVHMIRAFLLLFCFALPVLAADKPDEAPLHQAIYSNDTARVLQLLDAGADIEVLHSKGWTPLQYAVGFKKEAIVRVLLKRGADPNQQGGDYRRKTAMDFLSLYGAQVTLKPGEKERAIIRMAGMLFDAGADVNQSSPLALAIGARAHDLVNWLLDHGADVSGDELLVRAAEQRTPLDVMKRLVEKGAKVNGANFYGGPLARSTYDVEQMKFLVSKGADINFAHKGGLSAMEAAADGGHFEAVKYLVGIDAEVDAHDGRAIKRATERGHTAVVDYLAQHGSSVDFHSAIALGRLDAVQAAIKHNGALLDDAMPGAYKMNPIHLATRHGQIDVLKWLLANGANPNAVLLHDETALHLAVTMGDEAAVRVLLANKADPNRALIAGMYGFGLRTPLHYALGIAGFRSLNQPLEPNVKLVELLIQNGASVDVKDESGRTIAENVRLHGSEELKRLVLETP